MPAWWWGSAQTAANATSSASTVHVPRSRPRRRCSTSPRRLLALVGGKDITADDIVLLEDYGYPIYGVPSKETVEAIRLSARLEGMITDPVYEGKSMQGMIDLVQKGFFPKGSKVLYAHLGGAPALNGYSYTFRNG